MQINGVTKQSNRSFQGPEAGVKCSIRTLIGDKIMKRITYLSLILSLLIIWGCSKDSSPVSDEQALDELAIQNAIADIEDSEDGDYFYSNLDDGNENNFPDIYGNSFTTLGKQIKPLRFGRLARPIYGDVRIIFTSDTTAKVLFRKIMRGQFRILAADTSNDTIMVYPVNKKLGHEFQRIAFFAKRGEDSEERRGWKLVKFSMGFGESFSKEDSLTTHTDLTITKMIVQTDSIETTITDPLSFFQTKRSVFAFKPGTDVTVTVHVENALADSLKYIFPEGTQGTELVRLHHARHRNQNYHAISRLEWIGQDQNGNNIYRGTWTTGHRFGIHHAVIDVINNGTILDDDVMLHPYNSVTWGTPYLIKRQ